MLAPFAGAALALALLAGCGGEAPAEDPTDGTTTEESTGETPTETPTEESTPDDGATSTDDDSAPEDTEGADDPADDADGDDDADDDPADAPDGENLFEGSWTMHHDSKVLSAEELADLIEEEAEARGPEEMSLDVECADGVDTVGGDDTAECIAYADEGVEHPWAVSVGPADAGLVIEIENVD